MTVNDPERLPMTLSFHLCHMETKQNTFGNPSDPEILPMTGSE